LQAVVQAPNNPDEPADFARLEREIDAFNLRWEIQIHRIMAVLIIAAAVMILAISPWIGSELAVPEIALCTVAILYFTFSSLLLRRIDTRWLARMRWVSVTSEASFGTLAIGIGAFVKGPEWATTSPTILIYALVIVSCAIRIRPKLTAYCALVACVEYLALYYLYLAPQLDASSISTSFAWAAWERVFWLALIGGSATFASIQVRKTALAGSAQAMRRAWVEQEMARFMPAEASSVALSGMARTGFVDRRRVTVLFCDLRDFTGLCEREQPDDVIELLNEFYARACAAVKAAGGQVNKFLGDGLLALFDEETTEYHADAAVKAGRDLVDIAADLRRRGGIWEQLSVSVGVDSGLVVIGTVGGNDRLELTAIGSPVNRAARLQSVARFAPRRVVISSSCAALLCRTHVRSLGAVAVKGFDEPVKIYAPTGEMLVRRVAATHVSTIPQVAVATPT
jgi:adenylate cyclase